MKEKMHREHGLSFLDFIFGLLIVAGLAYVLVVGPWIRDQKIADLRAQPPIPSIEARKLVAVYEKKPTPVAVPTGEYVGHIDLGGQVVPITYYFGANSVLAVEATIKGSLIFMRPKVTLAGSAPYTFTGSLLVFGDVTGDKVLFSPLGLPIDVKSADELVVRSGRESVTLRATRRAPEEARGEAQPLRSSRPGQGPTTEPETR